MSAQGRQRLPLECIRCVIAKLDGDISTLFQLLTVHSSFFTATLPVLYRDPYRVLKERQRRQAIRENCSPKYFDSTVRAKQLLYILLLSCRNADELVPFLSVDWRDPLRPAAGNSLMATYIDYLGDLDFDRWTDIFKEFVPEFDTLMEERAIRLFRLLFLDHHKEHVQTLSIPITHLEPYEAMVSQLRSLKRIRFYEDEVEEQVPEERESDRPQAVPVTEPAASEVRQEDAMGHEATEPGEMEHSAGRSGVEEGEEGATEEPTRVPPVLDSTSRAAVFIKAHRAFYHPGCVPEGIDDTISSFIGSTWNRVDYGLQQVEVPLNWLHSGWSESEGTTHDMRYIDLLKALENPVDIQFEDWEYFSRYLENVPLESVRRVRGFCSDWEEARWDQAKVLQRCRQLQQFSAALESPTVFQWATEEQKDRDIYKTMLRNGVAGPPRSLGRGRSHGGHFGPGPDPVPLRKILLKKGDVSNIAQAFKDICLGFTPTLESIQVHFHVTAAVIPLGIVHQMPRLTTLVIHHNRICQFTEATLFLKECPQLRVLRLVDGDATDPFATDRPLDIQEPWQLPYLHELVLVGSAYRFFNYGSLGNSPNLETVRLKCNIQDMGVRTVRREYFDYYSHPSWSWNWKLPRLLHLTLEGWPAHLLRLPLLLGCPKLEKVTLDLGSVPRTITNVKDLCCDQPGFQSPVRSLDLRGRWIMTAHPCIFAQFLHTWFNGLCYLNLDATEFCNNDSLMDGLISTTSLQKACMRRHPLSEYDAWELGLERTSLKCSREWDQRNRQEIARADGMERRRAAKQQRREEELQELARAEEILENERAFENMLNAFSFLIDDILVENDPDGQGTTGLEEANDMSTCKGRVRCDSVDSACDVDLDDSQPRQKTTDEIREEQEEKEEQEKDVLDSLRCIYKFKGKRYVAKACRPLRTHKLRANAAE